jgi:hypothetical protein
MCEEFAQREINALCPALTPSFVCNTPSRVLTFNDLVFDTIRSTR